MAAQKSTQDTVSFSEQLAEFTMRMFSKKKARNSKENWGDSAPWRQENRKLSQYYKKEYFEHNDSFQQKQ